jgi:hypothetical protein
MARFIGNVNTRLGAVSAGFSQAAVFTDPGTTTFQVPTSAARVKVITIGAGSNYRPGRYCGTSSACWSGVTYPSCNYSFDFCGHLMGAGGGYSEKLYTTGVAGQLLNIQVGSPTYNANSYFVGTNGGNCNTINIDGNYSGAVYVGASVSAPNGSIPAGTTVTNITRRNITAVANTSINNTRIFLSSTEVAANVLPGSTVQGPGVLSGTLVTNVAANGMITINSSVSGNSYNETFNFYGTQLTLSNNFTSGSNSIVTAVIAGPTSTSVSGLPQTITATNATEFPFLWTCQSQTTARNSQYDVPITAGFELPVCGYTNCYNAWYNIPGTGSGGDVNYSGGTGVLAPVFVGATNVFDTNYGAAATAGGSHCGGWTTPYIYCFQVTSYHNVFGVTNCCGSTFPNCYPCNCVCPFVCNCLCNYPSATPGPGMCHVFYGSTSSCYDAMATTAVSNSATPTARIRDPIGVGASSGSQAGTGNRASVPEQVIESNWNKDGTAGYTAPGGSGGFTATSGTGSNLTYYYTLQGYDEQFGGTGYNCVCVYMFMGCVYGTVAAGAPVCGASGATSLCYFCMGNGFVTTFGMPAPRSCACFPYQASGGGGGAATNSAKCMAISYDAEKINGSQFRGSPIPLGVLTDVNGNNNTSIEYGLGATNKKAQLGGGGNRYYPAGGNGAVVVMWG